MKLICTKSILLKVYYENIRLTKGEIIEKERLLVILDYMDFSQSIVNEYFTECNELGEVLYG